MKLKDLTAAVSSLLSRAQGVDAAVRAEVDSLKAKLDGAVTQLTADLATATTTIGELTKANESLSIAANGITTSLDASLSALQLETKPDASALDKIAALQSAVSNTLAKLNVAPEAIPAAKPSDTNKPAGSKTMTIKEFNALNAAQKMAFTKEINLGAAKLTE